MKSIAQIAEMLRDLTIKEAPIQSGGLGFYWDGKGPMSRAEAQDLADAYRDQIADEYLRLIKAQRLVGAS